MNIQLITKMLIDAGIEQNEAIREVEMLAEHFCGYTQKDRILGNVLKNEDLDILKEKVKLRIETGNPVQYLIGKAYFMGEYFKVNPSVLIPRDETEILVRQAIEIINNEKIKNVLDIGTGSGCIACTIAKNTDATVLGTDISSDALKTALDNVTKLGINNRAIFRKSDLFSKIREEETFGMIISNPPYIPTGTILSPEVMKEPKEALFANENGLELYRKIVEQAPKFLNSKGYILFELGINESESVKKFLEKEFENIKITKDLAGIDRVIIANKKV